MKYAMTATILAGAFASSVALAQTTAPTTAHPTSPAAPVVTAPAPAPAMGTTGTTTGMGTTTATTPSGTTSATAPAAVTTTAAPSRTAAAPVAGANSFTEGQARDKIQEKGFGNVTDLKKDDKGVWRGHAMKDGKTMEVALDYQGNVVGH